MALSCGFYNSDPSTHDRKYDAVQISQIFDGIISNGVYSNYEKALIVKASSTNGEVIVQPGRAWFNHTWTLNDADLPVEAPDPGVILDRIDALCLDINSDVTARENTIVWVQGTEAVTPEKPTNFANTETHHQYPLCYVTRKAGTTVINQEDIENTVGTSLCPFVTGIIETLSADDLMLRWEASFESWIVKRQDDFDNWFANIQYVLDGDVAGHLQNEIDNLDNRVDNVEVNVSGHETTLTALSESDENHTDQLKANDNDIYMDYQDGRYGINTDPERGADTFIPFNPKLIDLGTGTSFNVSNQKDYKKFTVDNFFIGGTPSVSSYFSRTGTDWSAEHGTSTSGSAWISKSYNANTGILTCCINSSCSHSGSEKHDGSASNSGPVHVYLKL